VSVDQWIAFGTLGTGIVGLLAGGITVALKFAYRLGGHAERLAKLESAAEKSAQQDVVAQKHVTELAVVEVLIQGMKTDLANFMTETRQWKDRIDVDMRDLMRGDGKSASRRPSQ
jgi:hypothetical protein